MEIWVFIRRYIGLDCADREDAKIFAAPTEGSKVVRVSHSTGMSPLSTYEVKIFASFGKQEHD
jgi:hypothetical protein